MKSNYTSPKIHIWAVEPRTPISLSPTGDQITPYDKVEWEEE